jgi:hypothetical protein
MIKAVSMKDDIEFVPAEPFELQIRCPKCKHLLFRAVIYQKVHGLQIETVCHSCHEKVYWYSDQALESK